MDAESPCLKLIKKLIKNSQIKKSFFITKKTVPGHYIQDIRTKVFFLVVKKLFFYLTIFYEFFICFKQGLSSSTHVFYKKFTQSIKSRQDLKVHNSGRARVVRAKITGWVVDMLADRQTIVGQLVVNLTYIYDFT